MPARGLVDHRRSDPQQFAQALTICTIMPLCGVGDKSARVSLDGPVDSRDELALGCGHRYTESNGNRRLRALIALVVGVYAARPCLVIDAAAGLGIIASVYTS